MSKNNELFNISSNKLIMPFVLVVVSVLLVFFMIMVLSPVKERQDSIVQAPVEQKAQAVDLEKVEADYKEKTAQVVKDYSSVTGNASFAAEDIEKIKQQLLDLKVPTKYKDLHISLVMAMVKMENFLTSGSKDDKSVSEKAVNEAKKNYSWLN